MDIICAYFDVRGYYVDGSFILAEAAIFGAKTKIHLLFDTKHQLSDSQLAVTNVKDLDWDKEDLTVQEFKILLKKFLFSCQSESKFHVAVRSHQGERFLENMLIPCINLGLNMPTKKTTYPCPYHRPEDKYLGCALENLNDMIAYVKMSPNLYKKK